MKFLKLGIAATPLLTLAAIAVAQPASSGQSEAQVPPKQSGCCDGGWHGMMGSWPMGHGWHGPGPMPRHHVAMMWGIPEPYTSMTNPLPRTPATLKKGEAVYAANCVSCHGKEGLGDGEAGRNLSPPPGNLAWLSDMPMARWDAFMYWSIAEGGSQFGTAMPAFRGGLSKEETWAVTAFIQAHLPHDAK